MVAFIGVDVGGTFTDFSVSLSDGREILHNATVTAIFARKQQFAIEFDVGRHRHLAFAVTPFDRGFANAEADVRHRIQTNGFAGV